MLKNLAAFNRMIVDRELYNICKENAAKSAHLSLETISKQWESILY
jgi:hypothetical protein